MARFGGEEQVKSLECSRMNGISAGAEGCHRCGECAAAGPTATTNRTQMRQTRTNKAQKATKNPTATKTLEKLVWNPYFEICMWT